MLLNSSVAILVLCSSIFFSSFAVAHEGHSHENQIDVDSPVESHLPNARTGTGEYLFRYRADLSILPKEVAEGIKQAHGGFAITPTGHIYFGLEGTGIVRISPDLNTMEIVNRSEVIREGGLHNTTYTDRDGGLLIFPDNKRGEIHITSLEGEELKKLGRPQAEIQTYYAEPNNSYNPTDTEVAPNGMLYITDGYSPSKFVLTADLEKGIYIKHLFGTNANNGPNKGPGAGRFTTCHGITWDATNKLLVVADREHFLLQKFDLAGNFVTQVGVEGASPCNVEFVKWNNKPLAVVPCLRGPNWSAGVIKLYRDDHIVATLKPKKDLGLESFQHIHHAIGTVVEGKLFILCYGWNPGCYAVLEQVSE